MSFACTSPTEWFLPISPDQRDAALVASRGSRFQGAMVYLNALCFESFLPWFQAEYEASAKAWLPAGERPSLWSCINGSAMTLANSMGNKRIVLLPCDSSDSDGIEIPQEWMDIPGWAADYFLAVRVDPDGEWLAVWSYVTHAQVKAEATYDSQDRTYYAAAPSLCPDLNSFWTSLQLCPNAVTQGAIAPLPELPSTQVEALLRRLGNPELAFPNLAIPFTQWAGLLQQSVTRRQFAQLRQHSPRAANLTTRLSQWLESSADAARSSWQSVESLLGEAGLESLAFNFRGDSVASETTAQRAKSLTLSSPPGGEGIGQSVTLMLMLLLTSEQDGRTGILVQLHPPKGQEHLPAGIELCLCSPQGEPLQLIEADSEDNYIQLTRFRCPLGTHFQVKVQLQDASVIESFVV